MVCVGELGRNMYIHAHTHMHTYAHTHIHTYARTHIRAHTLKHKQALQANWRSIFARIERAWDRFFILEVVRRWKHVTDDAILDNAESVHSSVVTQLNDARSQLDGARALVRSYADAQQRLLALETLTQTVTQTPRSTGTHHLCMYIYFKS